MAGKFYFHLKIFFFLVSPGEPSYFFSYLDCGLNFFAVQKLFNQCIKLCCIVASKGVPIMYMDGFIHLGIGTSLQACGVKLSKAQK